MCVDGKKDDDNNKIRRFCLFANKSFNKGRGLLAFTTPQIAKHILLSTPLERGSEIDTSNKPIARSTDWPKYEIRAFPGKRLGIAANQTFAEGDRIEHESTPWVFNHATTSYLDDEDRIPIQWHGMYMLPKQTRNELLALDKYFTGDEIDGLMRTNSFATQYVDGADIDVHWIVFAHIARFNHDCRPK